MSKNFEEQEKKAKGGIRLAREEVFKLVFGAELTKSTSDKLKQDFSVYLQNDEEFINALSEKQLEFIKNSINGIVENYDNIKDVIKKILKIGLMKELELLKEVY